MEPAYLCVGRACNLLPYLKYAYELEFDEKPDYSKLRHIFVKILLERNQIPDNVFDWNLNENVSFYIQYQRYS